MEKKTVFIFSDNEDYSGVVFDNLGAIEEWIKGDIEDLSDEELKEKEYTINVCRMTQEDFDKVPEMD